MSQAFHKHCMELAIEQMESSSAPQGIRVGAVIAQDGEVIAQACRVAGIHAERAAIEAALARNSSLSGSTLYTTLEPCVAIDSKREPCADLIAKTGISTVYIGRYDPNPSVNRLGWRTLRDAGLEVRDFPADLRTKIDELNRTFADRFAVGVGPIGGAKFDYQLHGGKFEIQFSPDDSRRITTQWSQRGADSIHAYAVPPVTVALARYARTFAEIDDAGALDFTYTVPVHTGEIAVFRSKLGAVLVRIEAVERGLDSGASVRFVKITFEVRPQ